MISKEHKKHTALVRPSSGNFHRNEWAILGAPCADIKLLAGQIIAALSPQYKCGYVDTSHNDENNTLPGKLASGAVLEYSDEINHRQLNYATEFNPFKLRETFAGLDVVLVNGNHHQAKQQVVIIDERKKTSLQKRVDQLTNVRLILLADGNTGVFDFIRDSMPGWQNIPVYHLDESDKITAFFKAEMQQAVPVLNGLVLAGGKSVRMGTDKGTLNWHGKEQRYHAADMLKTFCSEVFVSCRTEQLVDMYANYKGLADSFTGLGPYGAILSAFRANPNAAWLVVACDLPLLDAATLKHLVDNRNVSSIATSYISTYDGFPEPLVTIWEPKSYPVLLSFLAQGYSCPRKVLINSDVNLITTHDANALTNVNTPEELERVKSLIHQKSAAI